jgi:hypothetical protein
MALLHNALKLYAMYMISIIIYRWLVGRKKGIRCERPVRFFFVGLLVVCVIMLTQQYSEILQEIEWYMSVVQALEGANTFRLSAAAVSGRANYGVMMDTSSVLGYVKTIPMIFVHYMFAPFPWQVGNVKDVHALLESMLRFVLLFFAVYSWRRSSVEVRSYYSFLLIVVLGMELMWALGTLNWGTAMRHHVPGYSVIVLLGAPGLILFMRRLHFGIFGRGKVSCEKNEQALHMS